MQDFWDWYDKTAKPHLGMREGSMTAALAHLDGLPDPITIVETGCLRQPGNWGDGQSTMLFARYISARGKGARGYSVDLDPGATAVCRGVVGDAVDVRTGDSVAVLPKIRAELASEGRLVSLLYLDSYDVDFSAPMPSAIHHLMEFAIMAPALAREALVLVDDSPIEFTGFETGKTLVAVVPPRTGGKGRLLADLARRGGIAPRINGYQMGWVGLGHTS